jgi:precorrin-6B methylase 2
VNRSDNALVIAESAIDALSYAVLHPDERARYASIGGAMNPNQPALIQSAIQRLGEGARLIIATDNDEGGRRLAEAIAAVVTETGRKDIRVVRDLPEREGADWNGVLQEKLRVRF